MKIVITAGSLKENEDGVTRVLYRQVEYLRQHNVDFLAISPKTDANAKINNQFSVSYIPFPLYTNYKVSLPKKEKIKRIIASYEPDIVYINSPCSLGYVSIKICKELGIPAVATYHTHFPSYLRYYRLSIFEKLVWKYVRYFYNHCDAVIVPSTTVLEELKYYGIDNLVYLPHGVDTNLFNPNKNNIDFRNTLVPPDKKIVLFVGRIVKEKNFDVLEDAIRILSSKRDDFVLVVAGDGPYLRHYQKRIPNSLFLGKLDPERLSNLYASSDIFAFPSVTESFGNVILEAMASGLPPVVANSFGASELIKHNHDGLLAEPNDSFSLAENIDYLLSNDDSRRRLGYNAYQKSLNYSWDSILSIFYNILTQITSLEDKELIEKGNFEIDKV
ncbi:MAG: glycosyltransferase family 1 protein [Ignavibacteria bacterium]|nr:glycosyltransferase family 1 protein [Ignavibacteria bacterium]